MTSEPRSMAMCITDLDVGGAERCLVELATRLDRRRFRPVVYSLAGSPQSSPHTPCAEDRHTECAGYHPAENRHTECAGYHPVGSLMPMLEAAGVEVHCLGGRRFWHFPRVVRRLRRLLAVQQPQLVQTFLFHANIVGRIAARQANVGRVVCGVRVAERHSRWRLWLDRLTQGMVDQYVCVSRSVAQFTQTHARLPPEKLAVVPNGVDLSRYPAAPADLRPLGIAAGRRAITFVGRLERQKGPLWLVQTAPRWLARLPDCELLLVGAGPQRRRIELLCRRLGVAERVHLAGWRADVPEILAASSLLVLPSAWEGMPNVVLEAMASRLPVVATDVEGVGELLGRGANDQTVSSGDCEALAEKIVALAGDPRAAARLGAENRQRAEKSFALETMVAAYQDLWETILRP